MNKHFPKDNAQMSNKHTKRHSTSLAIREMKMKTIRICQSIPIRMSKISLMTTENTDDKNADKNEKCLRKSS
jgi:hypothetical protein